MSGPTLVAGAVALALLLAGCARDPEPTDGSAAEKVFVACAAGRGVVVEHVDISAGEFSVQVADDAEAEAVAAVQQECEPLALAALADAGDDEVPPDAPQVPAGVSHPTEYVDHLQDEGFSGVVLVQEGGEVTTAEALGSADREAAVPNELDTAFDIGSVAKVFTAAAVLRLVDAGELSLDDSLGELLDDVPDDKRSITVRQLLDFSSGLREYHDTEGDFEPMTRAQARKRILDQELVFEPGTGDAYSNSSYTLAAILAEEVTGRPFTELVAELFDEAGLTDTGFYGSGRLQHTDVARGYGGRSHGANDPASWETTWALLGSGGIVSTAPDLVSWWTQLQQPGLLSADSVQVLLDELVPAREVDGQTFRGVGGTNDFGFDALVAEVPSEDVLVVVLSNTGAPDRTGASEAGFVLAQLVTQD